jgi:hypothetical protein
MRVLADIKPVGHGYGSKLTPAGTDTGTTLNVTGICSRL